LEQVGPGPGSVAANEQSEGPGAPFRVDT